MSAADEEKRVVRSGEASILESWHGSTSIGSAVNGFLYTSRSTASAMQYVWFAADILDNARDGDGFQGYSLRCLAIE